jgi:ABC-2 type transport system permease protein
MCHTLTLYLRLISVQIRSQLHFRTSFLFEVIGTALITIFEFGSLALVLQRFGSLQGWTLGEISFLYGLVEISFGLMDMIFSGFDPPNFGKYVRQGIFDQLLLRPINITLQVLGSEFVIRRLGKITMGITIFAFALSHNNIIWTLPKLIYLPFVILGMILFFGGLFIAGATITFWTVESIEVMNILTYGSNYAMSHPMHIYQDWLRRFFTYIVPAIFLNYYPALYFLDKPDPFNLPPFAVFLAPFTGLSLFLLSLAFWQWGIRHYQSTGT